MLSVTRWQQDTKLDPTNPHQRIRYAITFPSGGGGYSAFGWSPLPLGDTFKSILSPVGVTAGSGLGAPLIPGVSKIATVAGALTGILVGRWAARANVGASRPMNGPPRRRRSRRRA